MELKDIIEAQKTKSTEDIRAKFWSDGEKYIQVETADVEVFLDTVVAETAQIVAREVLRKVRETLTREHYGISYETDTCIECSNHTRIKEALVYL